MAVFVIGGLVALVIVGFVWFNWRQQVTVPCTIDVERTHEHFHAHVDMEGIFPEAGDAVLVEGAPDSIEYGKQETRTGKATVRRASRLRQWWVRLVGPFEIWELFEVGFE